MLKKFTQVEKLLQENNSYSREINNKRSCILYFLPGRDRADEEKDKEIRVTIKS